jgi:BirA family biotin operon repressor/biotin-[acetyl-CoA-carboxylase] ligase
MSRYFLQYPKPAIKRARALRRNMTEAERKLWSLLRRKQLEVCFRRQVAVGPYVADFACLQPKIIIELDGSQHLQKKNADHDSARDAFLGKQGFRVFRFSDRELLTNPEGVIKVIYGYVCKNKKTIDPSSVLPSRGGNSDSLS